MDHGHDLNIGTRVERFGHSGAASNDHVNPINSPDCNPGHDPISDPLATLKVAVVIF